MHQDQQDEKTENQEGVQGPRTVVIVRPVERCVLERDMERRKPEERFWAHTQNG